MPHAAAQGKSCTAVSLLQHRRRGRTSQKGGRSGTARGRRATEQEELPSGQKGTAS